MDEKNLKKLWIISIFVILVLFSMYLVFSNKEKNIEDVVDKKPKYTIVTNYNDFYTVNSCVYRYLTYLQGKETDALLKVLTQDYVNEKGINKENIFDYLKAYDGNITFSSQKMYEEKISDNLTKYYIYGFIEKDVMDSFPEKKEDYFIVVLEKQNNLFSIEPYDGNIFR